MNELVILNINPTIKETTQEDSLSAPLRIKG
jgi:hypothetical protein